jgi:hypothetical protein
LGVWTISSSALFHIAEETARLSISPAWRERNIWADSINENSGCMFFEKSGGAIFSLGD